MKLKEALNKDKEKLIRAMKMAVDVVEKNKFENTFTRKDIGILKAIWTKLKYKFPSHIIYMDQSDAKKDFPSFNTTYWDDYDSINTPSKSNLSIYRIYKYSKELLKKNKDEILKTIDEL